jgi:hypothetical protein
MKLGNLCTAELKKQLFSLSKSEWERYSPERRAREVRSYIVRHRLGQKVSQFVRANADKFVTGDMPKPRLASEWICNHAMASAAEKSFKPMKAFQTSLFDVMEYHGMPTERKQELLDAFNNFQLQ